MAVPLRGGCLLSGQATTLGQSDLQNHGSCLKKLSCARQLRETDLSSKLRSRCGAVPIFDLCVDGRIPWPAHHSMTLARVLRGARSMLRADAMGCVASAAFSAAGSVTFVSGEAFRSCASVATKVNPLQGSRVSKRYRCDAVRMCLELR